MLSLTKITRSEMGAYLCIASNGVPPSVSKRMKVQVHCKLFVSFYHEIRSNCFPFIVVVNNESMLFYIHIHFIEGTWFQQEEEKGTQNNGKSDNLPHCEVENNASGFWWNKSKKFFHIFIFFLLSCAWKLRHCVKVRIPCGAFNWIFF